MYDANYLHWKEWDRRPFATTGPGEEHYFDRLFRKLTPARSKILEIGFGNGSLLGYFAARAHTVMGTELQEELVAKARGSGFSTFLGVAWDLPELQEHSFDLVVALDVAEHLNRAELESLFGWVYRHLNPEGHFVLRFPEGASFFGMPGQNGDFTHVTWLTKSKIQYLCTSSGLLLSSYSDDLISSNRMCSWGAFGKALLAILQAYRWLVGGAIRLFLFPLSFDLRTSNNSIAVVQHDSGHSGKGAIS